MKVGIIRGSFVSSAEMQNFEGLTNRNDVTVFRSWRTRDRLHRPSGSRMTEVGLFSPYDYVSNNRYVRGVANRLLVDSHYLFGLENRLKGFDIAHCAETYFHYTQQCLNAKKSGFVKAIICTVWENIPFNNEGIIGRTKFKKRAFKEVDLFLAVTKQAREALLMEGCNSNKIQVLMPGINIELFSHSKCKGKTVLFVGRNVPEKGIADLPKSNKNFIVKIVSNTPYGLMPKVYAESDVFVLPSRDTNTWREQYGMVLLEAMASGLPIVTTGTGAIKEVVGNAAIYTSASNLESTLTKLVNNKKEIERRGKMSRERVKKYFDCRNFSNKLEKIYEKVLKEK